jgi:hypothetical protein
MIKFLNYFFFFTYKMKLECKHYTMILGGLAAILFIILIVVLIKKKTNEGFYRNELKDSMSMVSASNQLINLDQTFGFFAGLNSETKNPLLTSGCILQAYNNKQMLNSLSNYMYQLYTGKIDENTFKAACDSLMVDFNEFQELLQNCKVKCDEPNDLSIFKITTYDFLLGFIVGLTIRKNGMMFPCFDLINRTQSFIYDNDIENTMLYINTMIQVNAGLRTMEDARAYLAGRNVNVDALIDSFHMYCSQGCGEVCNREKGI